MIYNKTSIEKVRSECSHLLFPFVFWVSLLTSVLVRQHLWILSLPSSYIGSVVRLTDVLIILNNENISNTHINVSGIRIKTSKDLKLPISNSEIKPKSSDMSFTYQIRA